MKSINISCLYRTASLRPHNNTIQKASNICCDFFSSIQQKSRRVKIFVRQKQMNYHVICRTRYLVTRNVVVILLHTNSDVAVTTLLLLAEIVFCLCICYPEIVTRLQSSPMFLQPTN